MKNTSVIRRFIFGSIILGLIVPTTYNIILNTMRSNHFARLSKQVCKAIEPRIQIGAQREALEFLKSTVSNQDFSAFPEIEFKDHGNLITPPIQNIKSLEYESCEFQGITGVEVKIYYQKDSILNIFYFYLYLASVPFLFLFILLFRSGVLRFQRKVADLIERQMKQIFGIGVVSEPEKESLLFKLFDLEIPLLKYLKGHVEGLEKDLAKFSAQVAEQQKKEVLMNVAAQMAHDIVTPISNLQTILASDEKKQHQDLILSELGQIKNLSEKLLRQYRGESAEIPQKNDVIDVVECTRSALESVKLFAKNICPVDFEFHHDPLTKVFLKGESAELTAAVSNILRNSVEAIYKESGQIIVKLNLSQEVFELSVSDNGCGIKAENLHRIFDNKISIGKSKGTGIGLYQVKTAIEKMKGFVNIESTVGSGTQIKLSWPISEIKVEKALKHVEIDQVQFGIDMVLVDDSKAIHTSWNIQAKRAQKKLMTFYSLDGFTAESHRINKAVPIFVDYTFIGSPISGKEIAQKIMAEGFQNVHITTGFPEEHVDKPAGIKSVLGKEFPQIGFLYS